MNEPIATFCRSSISVAAVHSALHSRVKSSNCQPVAMSSEKEHLSIVNCGHVDSGKSTTTGRLLFELGGLPERELEKLKQEAERLGKSSFAFAFFTTEFFSLSL